MPDSPAQHRRKLALTLADHGRSYREVGLKLGISKKRAGHLIRRARKERCEKETKRGT